MSKKFLAKLLIFCMVFTMMPFTAFAAATPVLNANGDTYAIEWDTDATTVRIGSSVNVAANVVYTCQNDTFNSTKPVTSFTAKVDGQSVSGLTVAGGKLTVPETGVAEGKKVVVTATATVDIDNKPLIDTIEFTVEAMPVMEPEVSVSGTTANASLDGAIDTSVIASAPGNDFYTVGSDTAKTLVINLRSGNAGVKAVALTITPDAIRSLLNDVLKANVQGIKSITLATDVADIQLNQKVLEALVAKNGSVALNVTKSNNPEEAVKATYDITFTVGGQPVMANADAGLTVTLTVPNPLDRTTGYVYVYYYNSDNEYKYDDTGITDPGFTEETPVRVAFTAAHFSTIVITDEEQETGNGEEEDSRGSSGGGSSSNVKIASKVVGGTVTYSPSHPSKGQTVTITVKPAEGYKLDTLTVTDRDGKTVELTKVDDTHYTFVMPAGTVTITPTFVKIDEQKVTTLTFSDVKEGDWFAKYVAYVVEKGMMKGYEDGRFGPNDYTTRAQIVTVLYRLEGEPDTSSASFSDVSGGQYYSDAVAWAANNGIVKGYETGKFGPSDNVTREQIAAILYRYAEYKNIDTSAAGDITTFSDAASVSDWSNDAIAWAVAEGLMNGDNGALRPQGNATRAEIAAMLMRFCENVLK